MGDLDATTLRGRPGRQIATRKTSLISGTVLALLLTAGCTGSGEGSRSDTASSTDQASPAETAAGPRRTLLGVATAVCGEKPLNQIAPAETERSTSSPGASCDDTDIRLFKRPSGRDSWVSIARESEPVLVGSNWAVASDQRVLTLAQPKLGGEIVRQQPRTGIVDENDDRIDDQAFGDTDCSVAFTRDDQQELLKDCLANGGH
jgi:hypothetical protein